MAKRELRTVRELLFWSYANLAMAHASVKRDQKKYSTLSYMIRAKTFKGLMDGSMNVRTLFDDERIKLSSSGKCSYCGASGNLALDHLIPRKSGGPDTGDNLIHACKACNSSKGKKNLMEWMAAKGRFPPLMILRRYLKLVIKYCMENDLMDCSLDEVRDRELPFRIDHIPTKYPPPDQLNITAAD